MFKWISAIQTRSLFKRISAIQTRSLSRLPDFGRRLQNLVPEVDPIQLYTEELEALQKLLPFPEEVAMRLTEVEHALFNSVPPMYYIRHITLDLSRTSTATRHPNVQDLIQRFNEVSAAESDPTGALRVRSWWCQVDIGMCDKYK